MRMSETTQLDTTLVRSLVRQAIALHKTSIRQREAAREVAKSLPRETIRQKAEVNAALRAVVKGAEITPETAVEILDRLRAAEQGLQKWRDENKDLLSRLSTETKNLWVHINALKALGAQLPQLPEGGD
jgi:hypothetical protein